MLNNSYFSQKSRTKRISSERLDLYFQQFGCMEIVVFYSTRAILDYISVRKTRSINVNSEIFARILFSRNFAYFRENKILEKWRNHSVV